MTTTKPKSAGFRKRSSFTEIPREPALNPKTLIQVASIKRWWRQRALLFENLSCLTSKRLEQANETILQREAQLRDAVFLITWFRSKYTDKEAILQHRLPQDPHARGSGYERVSNDEDVYEDEIRNMMRELEREAKLSPVEDDYDFDNVSEEEEWRSKNFAGFCLLKHWKRRCLATERSLLKVMREREQEREERKPHKVEQFEVTVGSERENELDIQSKDDPIPEYARHTSSIVDILNQTTAILRKSSDRHRHLAFIDKDPAPPELIEAILDDEANETALQATIGSKSGRNSKPSIDSQIKGWRQRYIARNTELREKTKELIETQRQLTTIFMEVDELRKNNAKLKQKFKEQCTEVDHLRTLSDSFRDNAELNREQLHQLDVQLEEKHSQIEQLQNKLKAFEIKSRIARDKEKEDAMATDRELRHRISSLTNELEVRIKIIEDSVTILKAENDMLSKSGEPQAGLDYNMRTHSDTVDQIEQSLRSLKGYLTKQKQAGSESQDPATITVVADLDSKAVNSWFKSVYDIVTEQKDKLCAGIEFAKKRIAAKVILEAKLGPRSPALFIHQYHYEQLLYFIQYLHDLVKMAIESLDGASRHENTTAKKIADAVPHFLRIYTILGTIALKMLENLAITDDSLAHITTLSTDVPLDMNVVYLQLQHMQDTILQLRTSSQTTIDQLMKKYRGSKAVNRKLKAELKHLKQEAVQNIE